MNILGIVPARAGSQTILRKNMFPLVGKPLIEYTLETTNHVNLSQVVISTNCEEVAKAYAKDYLVINRPEKLAQSDVPMLPVIQHALSLFYHECFDAVCLLQPTSPLRERTDIINALNNYKEKNATSLYSGYKLGIKNKDAIYDKHKTPTHFQRNGAIFITSTDLIGQGKLWDANVIEFEMPASRSVDIDTMDDMEIAEALLVYRKGRARNE